MKIGFDAKRLFLNDRGLGNYARTLVSGLAKHYLENEYVLFTPRVSNKLFQIDKSITKIETVAPKGMDSMLPGAWRSLWLGNNIRSNKIDVFHGLSQELPQNINRSNAKSVVTIHDLIFIRHPEFYKHIDRWIYNKKVKLALAKADKVIAISEQTKDDIISEFGISNDRVQVIYQTCNEAYYCARSQKEKEAVKRKYNLPDQYLFCVGALNDNKNFLMVLQAMALMKGKFDLPLVIVGKGVDYRKKLMRLAEKHKLSSRLIFVNDVGDPTPEEMSSIYQMSNAYIMPSFYEGFGIPIIEARFSGVPVLASNSSCLKEAGGENAYYFSPDSPEELAEGILKMTKKKVAEDKSIMKFHSQETSRQLVSCYQQLN